jgi:hypothetical protein
MRTALGSEFEMPDRKGEVHVVVGLFADDLMREEGEFAEFRRSPETDSSLFDQFERLTKLLESKGICGYSEPGNCSNPYDGYITTKLALQKLRLAATHLLEFGRIRVPSGEQFVAGVIERSYKSGGLAKKRFLESDAHLARRSFQHLIYCGQYSGFYVPADFPLIIEADEDLDASGKFVGSSIRLLDECNRLADAIELPETLTSGLDEEWDFATGPHVAGSRRYSAEAHACCVLREAALNSIETGCAILLSDV